jgi:hypothetical protein
VNDLKRKKQESEAKVEEIGANLSEKQNEQEEEGENVIGQTSTNQNLEQKTEIFQTQATEEIKTE